MKREIARHLRNLQRERDWSFSTERKTEAADFLGFFIYRDILEAYGSFFVSLGVCFRSFFFILSFLVLFVFPTFLFHFYLLPFWVSLAIYRGQLMLRVQHPRRKERQNKIIASSQSHDYTIRSSSFFRFHHMKLSKQIISTTLIYYLLRIVFLFFSYNSRCLDDWFSVNKNIQYELTYNKQNLFLWVRQDFERKNKKYNNSSQQQVSPLIVTFGCQITNYWPVRSSSKKKINSSDWSLYTRALYISSPTLVVLFPPTTYVAASCEGPPLIGTSVGLRAIVAPLSVVVKYPMGVWWPVQRLEPLIRGLNNLIGSQR